LYAKSAPRSSEKKTLQRELGPLKVSGTTIFDNRKVGTFPPELWADYGLLGGEMVGTITSSARDVEQYCG
jgi:hypothetical protein